LSSEAEKTGLHDLDRLLKVPEVNKHICSLRTQVGDNNRLSVLASKAEATGRDILLKLDKHSLESQVDDKI
jgi:hypothetical protein